MRMPTPKVLQSLDHEQRAIAMRDLRVGQLRALQHKLEGKLNAVEDAKADLENSLDIIREEFDDREKFRNRKRA